MKFGDKATSFFWAFLFLVTLLQLSASKEMTFMTALSYTICVVVTYWLYLKYLSTRTVQRFFSRLPTVLFLGCMGALCVAVAMILIVEGFLVFTLAKQEESTKTLFEDSISVFTGLFSFSALVSGLHYSVEKYKAYLEQEKELERLKRKSLEMELHLLRNQLSPHFTFNVLNNLQFLIRKDQDEALQLLSRYSKILRYYVYESQKKWISLEQEIAFLKEYFNLEINRHDADLKIECYWQVPENEFNIVPFILSAFVENAFKHVLPNQSNEYLIKYSCTLQQQGNLVFEIINTFDERVNASQPTGVGLKHVQERLALAYPNEHHLSLNQHKELFSVRLELKLQK